MSIKKILKTIGSWFVSASKTVSEALSFGRDLANQIKQYSDSPLLDVVVMIIPGDIDDKALKYVRVGLTTLIKELGWADKKVSDFSQKTVPHVLNTLASEGSALVAEFKGADLSRQQAISAQQLVYNPTIIK